MEEQEPALEEKRKWKIVWEADKIMGVGALLISLAACLLLAYQTTLMREQQLLSALPHLTIGNQGSLTPNFKFVLSNHGIGPAFIEEVNISYRGKADDSQDLAVFFMENSEEFGSLHHVFHSNVFPGMLVPAGEELAIFEVANSREDAVKLHEIMKAYYKDGFTYELIYSSVYGERWKITESSVSPEKL